MKSLAERAARIDELDAAIDAALADVDEQVEKAAAKQRAYRAKKAEGYVRSRGQKMIADERKVWVEDYAGDAEYERDLAAELVKSTRLVVDGRKAQMSGQQSVLAAHKAEADLVRTSTASGR